MKSKILAGIVMLALFVCVIMLGEYVAEATIAFSGQEAIPPRHTAPYRVGYVDITLDGAYPAGGWAVASSALHVNSILLLVPPNFKIGYGLEWVQSTGKIKAYIFGQQLNGAIAATELYQPYTAVLNAQVIRCFYMGY